MLLRHASKSVQSQTFFALGALSLVASLLLSRFGSEYQASDFVGGMLIGIALVMNIAGLWLFGRSRRENR